MMGPRTKGFLSDKLSGLADALGQIAEVVSSAGELLVDPDLRRKGAKYIVQEASRGINEAQRGIEAGADALGRTIQQGAQARFGAGARKLQLVLRNIERQIQEFQRQQQQQDLQAEIDHHHKLPVDIQIGDQVFEDMPQEMRSRFWYVLLERPDLAQQLMGRAASGADPSHPQEPSSSQTTAADRRPNSTELQASSSNTAETSSRSQAGTEGTPVDVEVPHSPPAVDASLTPRLSSPFAAQTSCPTAADRTNAVDKCAISQGLLHSSALTAECMASTAEPVAAGTQSKEDALDACVAQAPQPDGIEQQPHAQRSSHAAAGLGGDSNTEHPPVAMPAADSRHQRNTAAAAAACSEAGAVAAPRSLDECRSHGHNTAVSTTTTAAATTDAVAYPPRAPSPWTSGHNVTAIEPPGTATQVPAAAAAERRFLTLSDPSAPSPWDPAAPSAETLPAAASASKASAGPSGVDGDCCTGALSSEGGVLADAAGPVVASTAAASAAEPGPERTVSAVDGEGWEMVSRDVPSVKAGLAADAEVLQTVKTLVDSLSEAAPLDDKRAAQQAVFQAMLEVPWVAGEGILDSPTDSTQYAALLEAGCGSIEEVILRDVPRTFPEHPLFSDPSGQQKLLRVLKAYAAADPEVGYCQGMAFAAGVLLMYLPEEPAFRSFQRLMSPQGANLRRYYLPGLDHLKIELSAFELLLSTRHPQLHQHLLESGLPALLYAAQWLMTTYACPFPIHVAARVLDVLLQCNTDAILPRFGLAVMDALSDHLLDLEDFEELITYLKVQPLSWPLHMHRKVFAAAMHGTATEQELQVATAAARDEFVRNGRAASFSNKYLARQATAGGSTRLQLAPGPFGPKSLAATDAAVVMSTSPPVTDGCADDGVIVSAHVNTSGDSGSSQQQQSRGADAGASDSSPWRQHQHQRQLSGQSSYTQDAVLVGSSVTSALMLDELDALEELITDLDLLLPGGTSDSEAPASPKGAGAAAQQQQQQQQPQ